MFRYRCDSATTSKLLLFISSSRFDAYEMMGTHNHNVSHSKSVCSHYRRGAMQSVVIRAFRYAIVMLQLRTGQSRSAERKEVAQ